MIHYFTILIIIPILGIISLIFKDSIIRKKLISTVIFIILFVLISLRSPYITNDTPVYLTIFKNVEYISIYDVTGLLNATTLEVGYTYLNKLISYISMNSQWYISFMAFLTLFLMKKFIDKQSEIIWLSYYLLVSLSFYIGFFSMIRQGLAMAIIAWSYNFLSQGKKIKFILLICLAFTIHNTAIIFLAVILIINAKISLKNNIILFLIGVIFYVFSDKVLQVFFNNSDYYFYSYKMESGQGGMLLFLYLIIFIASNIFGREYFNKYKEANILYFIAAFAVILQILSLDFSLFSRVALYFSLFQIILIPNVIANIKDKGTRNLGVILVVLLSPILLYINLDKNLGGVVPYLYFWQ